MLSTRNNEFTTLGLSPVASHIEYERVARRLQAQEFAKIAGLVGAKLTQFFAAKPATASAPSNAYKLSPREQAYLEQGEALAEGLVSTGNLVSKFVNWLGAPVKAYVHRSAMRTELTSLDDRTLADIGMTRGDIERVANGLWVPENRSAQISPAALRPAIANHDKPQIAA